MDRSLPPYYKDCLVPLTVMHFMAECPSYSDIRLHFMAECPSCSDIRLHFMAECPSYSDIRLHFMAECPSYSDIRLHFMAECPSCSDIRLRCFPQTRNLSTLDTFREILVDKVDSLLPYLRLCNIGNL